MLRSYGTFNALGYRHQIDEDRFDVVIPKEGSVTSGYATVINKYAKTHIFAMLAREYILSDAGQENLAKAMRVHSGRSEITTGCKKIYYYLMMYTNAQPVKDQKKWEDTTKQIPQLYQEQVLIHAK